MKSNINLCVLPECYLDTSLLETLVPPEKIGSTRGYNHKHSCNKVVDDMLGKLQDDFAVGIVDKDRRSLERTAQFVKIDERHGLRLCKDPNKNHYLIFHPPIEQWLLDEAKQVGIALDAEPYGLPTTLKGLLQETKHENSKHDKRFKYLFRDLKAANAPGINLLAKWIVYLKSNPNNTDTTIFQNL